MRANAATITTPPRTAITPDYIRWFSEIGIEDIPAVGGKNASLGEMYRELSAQGVKVPNGFVLTADAYRYFLSEAELDTWIIKELSDLNPRDLPALRECSTRIRHAIIEASIAVCRKRGRKIGICGQAPSDYPDFAQFLVECGIDSISLNPDTVLKTTAAILAKEKLLGVTKTL